ncbi:MAG: hypothetical protein SV062_07495 [Thermodesulfobacteriota bacterium]|nr:hypothetical protein [Thermodesulfobacteriota bacterium]
MPENRVTINNIRSISIMTAIRITIASALLSMAFYSLLKQDGGGIWFWYPFFILLLAGIIMGFVTGSLIKFRFDNEKKMISVVWDKKLLFVLLPFLLINLGSKLVKSQWSIKAHYLTDCILLLIAGLILGRTFCLLVRIYRFQKKGILY